MTMTDTALTPAQEAANTIVSIHWDPSKWMGRDLLETWMDIGSEVQNFIAERIREDVKMQHRVLHCTTPAELHQIQAEFLQKAIEDYVAETGRMIDLGQRMFSPQI